MNEKILLVEDDEDIARIVTDHLKNAGYIITWSSTGLEGLEDFKNDKFKLAIVDLMLPEMDGFTLCKNIRLISDIPLIIMSAKNTDKDKVLGLKLGADDYITKPFSLVEMEARISSHLRRYNHFKNEDYISEEIIDFDNGLSLNKDKKEIYLNGKSIPFTQKEYCLLSLLAENPGKTFSKKELYEHIWVQNDIEDNNTVTVHIKEIRNKLNDNVKNPIFIQTIWGTGYKFIGKRLS